MKHTPFTAYGIIAGMKFTLHTTFPQELEKEWNDLLAESAAHVPFLRFEYLQAWWSGRGGGEWPQTARLAIVTAREGQRLVGIAPLFHVPHYQEGSALLFLGAVEISDYLDFIVRPADTAEFLAGLLDFLPTAGLPAWQTLDLHNLLDSSPTLSALPEVAARAGWKLAVQPLQHSPYIPLPGDWETYLAGIDKKQRHEIRRKMRRAEEMEVPAQWYIVRQAEGLEDEVRAFMDLMAQDPEKAYFLTPAMRAQMLNTARCAFQQGCLHLAFLTVNGEKAAGYLSFDYLNRLWVYNSGLDRRFMEYSPGWVLLGYLLQWANENKYSEFDFMRGDEEYKYRFGAVDRFVMRATLAKP